VVGFVVDGCIGEDKGGGGNMVEFWSLWCSKWSWRRKKMLVGSCSYCCCSGDEGGIGGGIWF